MSDRPILFSAPMVRALLAGTKTQTRRVVKPQPYDDPVVKVRMHSPGVALIGCLADAAVGDEWVCPYGVPGDRLWVRETWTWNGGMVNCQKPNVTGEYHELYTTYAADGARRTIKPSGFVPVPEQPPQRAGEPYSLYHAPEDFRYTGENTYMDRLSRWWNRKIPSIHMPRWASRITLNVTGVRVERLQDISEADAQAEGCALECMTPAGDDSGSAIHGPGGYRALWESINGAESWEANPWVWVISFSKIRAAAALAKDTP